MVNRINIRLGRGWFDGLEMDDMGVESRVEDSLKDILVDVLERYCAEDRWIVTNEDVRNWKIEVVSESGHDLQLSKKFNCKLFQHRWTEDA